MGARDRSDRGTAAVLVLVGAIILVAAVAMLAEIPADLGSDEPAMQAHVITVLLLNALPAGIGGLLAFAAARTLWRGRPGGRSLAAVWAAGAGLLAGILLSSYGSIAWVARVLLLEPDRWRFDWPWFRYEPFGLDTGTPLENLPGTRLDSVQTWYPGVLALGALIVVGFLVAGWIARRRGTQPGG